MYRDEPSVCQRPMRPRRTAPSLRTRRRAARRRATAIRSRSPIPRRGPHRIGTRRSPRRSIRGACRRSGRCTWERASRMFPGRSPSTGRSRPSSPKESRSGARPRNTAPRRRCRAPTCRSSSLAPSGEVRACRRPASWRERPTTASPEGRHSSPTSHPNRSPARPSFHRRAQRHRRVRPVTLLPRSQRDARGDGRLHGKGNGRAGRRRGSAGNLRAGSGDRALLILRSRFAEPPLQRRVRLGLLLQARHFLWARGVIDGCSASEYCPSPT